MNFQFKHKISNQDTLEDKAIIGVIGIPGHLKVLGGPHLGDEKKICKFWTVGLLDNTGGSRGSETWFPS